MSSISKDEVRKTAYLARLYKLGFFPEESLDKITNKIQSIIDYYQDMKKIDTKDVDFLSGWRTTTIDNLRDDETNQDQESYQKVRNNIIDNFPLKIDNMCAVDGVFANN